MDYQKLMDDARKTNLERDQGEESVGLLSERKAHPFVNIRTAMMAIETGIKVADWSCVAEAQALLEMAMGKINQTSGHKW